MYRDKLDRRGFLRSASAGALGAITVGCTMGASRQPTVVVPTQAPPTAAPAAAVATSAPAAAQAAAAAQQTQSALDRVLERGVLRLGVDLTFPPLQFRDAETNEPMGFMHDIDAQIAQDLGVELEYVEMPFGELIAGLLADKFDWIGVAFTSTPERAKQVLFIDEPTFFEDSVLVLRQDLEVGDLSELNNADVTFSNMSGSAQDASARLLFPEANFKPLGYPETLLEVAAGRSDAALIAIWNAAEFVAQNPDSVKIWPGGSLFSDVNTLFVPLGDYRTANWLSTWFRYYDAHGWIENRFEFWMNQLPGFTELQEQFTNQ